MNNPCPSLKSRENQCVALLCEPSWEYINHVGKLSFNRSGFHMAFKDVVRHWTCHSKLRWASRLYFPPSLLGSSNSIVQMWGFHPVVDMIPALWLEGQGCECHLILLDDPPKMFPLRAFYCFSLKEHLWSQPKTIHALHVEFWAPETVTPFFKESTLTSWRDLLMIFCNDGSRSCPLSFTSKKRVDMKRG